MSTAEITISINQSPFASPGWQHKLVSRVFSRITYGHLTVYLNDGSSIEINGVENGPSADISFRALASTLFKLWWKGDLGFAESYMDRHWDSSDLAQLLYFLSYNLQQLSDLDRRSRLQQWLTASMHRLNANTLKGSKRNIASHYDLGNDFYSRWLDSSMTYSSALFDTSYDMESAQQRKYQRLFDLLDAKPGQHILEIGCGWGGFAEHAARRGCSVTGITLSQQQLEYAKNRIHNAGLDDFVSLELRDYRHLTDQYDHIVSIEMIEAVGQAYWPTYFQTLKQHLRPGGNIALQSITIDESQFDEYVTNPGGFIQRYIFPGGMLPTSTHLHELATEHGLEVMENFAFGEDYATTLAVWHECFNRQEDWLQQNGYDEYFRRMWRYYLAFCEAGFRDGKIDVVHLHLRHQD